MASGRTPQRSGSWSLRQVSLEAGVAWSTARSMVRSLGIDAAALTAEDALVLRVAAMLSDLTPDGASRRVNEEREVPRRTLEAIKLVRKAGQRIPADAALLVTAETAQLAKTPDQAVVATLRAARTGQWYFAVPVGCWATEIYGERVPGSRAA